MTVQLADQGSIIKTAYDAEGNTVSADKTANYTLALTDAADGVPFNSASALVCTIPTNAAVAFPIGSYALIIRKGSGTLQISADTGVTLYGNGGSVSGGSCFITTQHTSATVFKTGADEWHVQGNTDTVA